MTRSTVSYTPDAIPMSMMMITHQVDLNGDICGFSISAESLTSRRNDGLNRSDAALAASTTRARNARRARKL